MSSARTSHSGERMRSLLEGFLHPQAAIMGVRLSLVTAARRQRAGDTAHHIGGAGKRILRLLNAQGSKVGQGVPKVQTIIIGFLVGAVASLAFRVWALVPLTLIMFL